ncbi:MAG: WxcM-like domain-containing protein [Syntrophobacteraceae bacterium]
MDPKDNTHLVAGDSVALMPGAYVDPGVIIDQDVRIGPNAVVLANTKTDGPSTVIRSGVEIGANATVLGGVTIGIKARVAPGAVVDRSVPPLAIVEGNPARITGYVKTLGGHTNRVPGAERVETGTRQSQVKGVTLHTLRLVLDLRGNLSVGEFEREIPFKPCRYFMVFDVPTAETRGEHAHRSCKQFLVAVRGDLCVIADDGKTREEFVLDRPNIGLYLPPMVWGIQYRYSLDAVLLVFASKYYDPNDYIRDYADFLALVRQEG